MKTKTLKKFSILLPILTGKDLGRKPEAVMDTMALEPTTAD
jgi:hypothetical protein